MKKLLLLIGALSAVSSACTPFYTWGYADTVHPDAASSYIRAVMSRELGDYETAVYYYNRALSRTDSDAVRRERDELRMVLNSIN